MAKIMLVDDDQITQSVLVRILERNGHDVVVAQTGKEATERAKDVLPALIVMDMNMPEMDGLEATRLIKRDDKTKHIPVLLLSIHSMPSYLIKASTIDESCNDYDTKPIDVGRFMSKVNTLLTPVVS